MNNVVLTFSHKNRVLLKNAKEIWSHLFRDPDRVFFTKICLDESMKEDSCEL